MSVRVSVCHSGIRPLCLPGAGDESLRLQLSMDPGKAGEFRLTLRDASGTTGRSVVRINQTTDIMLGAQIENKYDATYYFHIRF